MDTNGYGIKTEVALPYEAAVEKITAALKAEDFGVLTEIDVKATMKKKLDLDMEKYVILGACNPNFAAKVLEHEKDIGLLLPCNVIVYEKGDKTVVNAINPMEAMSVVKNDKLGEIAQEVTKRLKRAVQAVED